MANTSVRKTTEQFIEEAMAVHGDTYDYSQVDYVGNKVKVKIICPEHGIFEQAPVKHLIGQGCPKCSRKKAKKTWLKKYGVGNPRQSKEIADKIQQTVRDKYGVDYVVQSKEVREKSKETCIARYGVDNPMKDKNIKKKAEQTSMHKYGVKNPMQSKGVHEKFKDTMMSRYGVEYPLQSDDIKEKWVETNIEKYGVGNPQQNDDVKSRTKQTNLEKYGSENVFGSPVIMNKIHSIIVERYGVDYPAQNKEIYQKVIDTKRERNNFNTSIAESTLYDLLCEVFSSDDIETQYKSDKYPFRCDFYIKSRDMYIELNGLWTHNNHWYNESSDSDLEVLRDWIEKSKDSSYYEKAVEVWSKRDVLKRQTAIKNELNYIVFWDSELRDAELWFSNGCPDGNDAIKEYSWM